MTGWYYVKKLIAGKAQTSADSSLAALKTMAPDEAIVLFSVRAQLSTSNLEKAPQSDKSKDGAEMYFTIKLGTPISPSGVRRTQVTIVTPQAELTEANISAVSFKCTFAAQGEVLIEAWSTPGRSLERFIVDQKGTLTVDLMIATTDAHSRRN